MKVFVEFTTRSGVINSEVLTNAIRVALSASGGAISPGEKMHVVRDDNMEVAWRAEAGDPINRV